MADQLRISRARTPGDGPGFIITGPEVALAELKRHTSLDVRILDRRDGTVPVAFLGVRFAQYGELFYAPDFSDEGERVFLAALCHVDHFDFGLSQDGSTVETWLSVRARRPSDVLNTIAALLDLPQPSFEEWNKASDEMAEAIGLS